MASREYSAAPRTMMTSAGRTSSAIDWRRMSRATDITRVSAATAAKAKTRTAINLRARFMRVNSARLESL